MLASARSAVSSEDLGVSPFLTFVTDADALLVYVDAELADLVGRTPEELLGSAYRGVLAPTPSDESPSPTSSTTTYALTHVVTHQRTLLAATTQDLLSPDGVALGTLHRCVIFSAPEDFFFTEWMEQAPEFSCVVSEEAVISAATPTARGYIAAQSSRHRPRPLDWIHPDDQDRVTQQFSKLVATPGASQRIVDVRVDDLDGSYQYVDIRVRNLLHHPSVSGLLLDMRDATDRHRLSADVARSNQAYHDLVQAMSEGVWVIDETATTTFVNRAMADMLGFAPSDIIGNHLNDFLVPLHDAPKEIADDQRDLPEGCVHVLFRHKNGHVVETIASLSETAPGIMAVVTDVTTRHQAERYAAQMLRTTEHVVAAKAMFLSSMSHEIQTPLHAILGYADLARSEATAPTAYFLSRLIDATEHLRSLVSALLNSTTVTDRRLRIEDFEALDVLRTAVELVTPSALHRAVRIEITPASSPIIRADRQCVVQALTNVLDNAIKFSPPRGTVYVAIETSAPFAAITVTDQGPGVPSGEEDRVFEPFVRGSNATTIPGSGIGLSTVRHLLTQMNGSIAAKRSSFTLRIPLARAIASKKNKRQELPLRLLHVDDDPAARDLIRLSLASRPYIHLTSLSTLSAAVSSLQVTEFDAVIVDRFLPDNPGEELVEFIRTHARIQHLPVVMTTASVTLNDTTIGRVDLYVVKPFGVDDLLNNVESLALERTPCD